MAVLHTRVEVRARKCDATSSDAVCVCVCVLTLLTQVERLYREVRAFAIPGGSEEIMLDLGVRQALRQAATNKL